MSELITRLERLTGPDREVDVEIFKAIGAPAPFQFMNKLIALEYNDIEQAYFARVTDDMQVRYAPPPYTASIDAAMKLVPDGWLMAGLSQRNCRLPNWSWKAELWSPEADNNVSGIAKNADIPAIALCIAALKARNHIEGKDNG